jgi:hypothetical protein
MFYEARLALGKAEMKYGNQAEGRARLAGVEKDAASSGFALVDRKAETLRTSEVGRLTSDLGPAPASVLVAPASRRLSRGHLALAIASLVCPVATRDGAHS